MYNCRKMGVLFALLFSASICCSQNLILNPGCDQPLINGQIPSWVVVSGSNWTQRSSDPSPFSGTAYFFAGVGSEAKLKQEIDIANYRCLMDRGLQKFAFIAYVRSYNQDPSDESNIEIQFLDLTNLSLGSYSFGPYRQTADWKKVDSVLQAPSGSRKVSIVLHSIRHNGSNNDGYYDALSLVPVNVISNPYTTTINAAICEGKDYSGYTAAGTYVDTFHLANGCDSVRTLYLTVKPVSYSTINKSICEGETFWGYGSGGNYTDTLIAANGCDSIRTLHLIVKSKSYFTINKTICEGQSFWGHSTAGVYRDTLMALNGCDSIRTLNLNITPRVYRRVDTTICQGQSYLGRNTTGIYSDTLSSVLGCDSIRILNLKVIPLVLSRSSVTICEGEKYLGHTLSGNYTDTLRTPRRCDSIVTTLLIVKKDCGIYFPTAFTPNGDGKNDVFRMGHPIELDSFRLSIYNRWGEKVFETSNTSATWNGVYKGTPQPTGVYVWLCHFVDTGGRGKNITGSFALIR